MKALPIVMHYVDNIQIFLVERAIKGADDRARVRVDGPATPAAQPRRAACQ